MMLLYTDPQLLHNIINFCIELETIWAKAQIEAGADAIWVGDCCASSSFISVQHFSEFAVPGAIGLINEIKKNAFSFYHAGEKSLNQLRLMADLGASAVNVSEGVDIGTIKADIGNKVCLMGNMDPIRVLWQGTPDAVRESTVKILRSAGGSGYIFNTGERIVRQTPKENVGTMIQTVRSFV